MKTKNPIVQKALNATVAKNANEPLIHYIKSNIQTKFPQSFLEGYTDGVTNLIERGNGKITILADRKARPALDQLKAKFEPDYVFAFVDYGRGKTGFTLTPRAHTKRGEFKVSNMTASNAKFAVTTKSGRSVVIDAPDYKTAEKEAKRRFGAGCIVDLVGNADTALNAKAALNWNYKNKYQWFVVTPSMSGACILAGNEYREDAQEVYKEIKSEEGIPCKIVSRRTLERAGIDPNAATSWGGNSIRKATANAAKSSNPIVQNALNAKAQNASRQGVAR